MSKRLRPSELDAMLARLVIGDLDSESFRTLQQTMRDDEETLQYCFKFVMTSAALNHVSREAAEAAKLVDELGEISPVTKSPARFKILQQLLSIAAIIIVILGGYALTSRLLRPQGPVAATLIHGINVKWGQTWSPTRSGSDLVVGDKDLVEGAVHIRLERGTDLMLRAPCRFTLVPENQVVLHQGMLTATVPPEALGFTVCTENATVVDQGTRFGVLVDDEKKVETHVFSGEVTVHARRKTTNGEVSLVEGAAVIVDALGRISTHTSANEQRFLLGLSKRLKRAIPGRFLSLADLVGMGNGYGTGQLNQGIDPISGTILTPTTPHGHSGTAQHYTAVIDSPYIDGVFVPSGIRGGVPISTTGLQFVRCPFTNLTFHNGLFYGAKLPNGEDPLGKYHDKYKGRMYGTPDFPALTMHPNLGITFDLDAIRQDHPGLRITHLQSMYGIPTQAPSTRNREMEFWILLNGKVAFHNLYLPEHRGLKKVDLTIDPEVRFLTLVTTCPDRPTYCWAFWGDPVLALQSESL